MPDLWLDCLTTEGITGMVGEIWIGTGIFCTVPLAFLCLKLFQNKKKNIQSVIFHNLEIKIKQSIALH